MDKHITNNNNFVQFSNINKGKKCWFFKKVPMDYIQRILKYEVLVLKSIHYMVSITILLVLHPKQWVKLCENAVL